jgi:hypothetical protein
MREVLKDEERDVVYTAPGGQVVVLEYAAGVDSTIYGGGTDCIVKGPVEVLYRHCRSGATGAEWRPGCFASGPLKLPLPRSGGRPCLAQRDPEGGR